MGCRARQLSKKYSGSPGEHRSTLINKRTILRSNFFLCCMNASRPELIPLLGDSSDVCNIFIHTSAVTLSTTRQPCLIFKSQWTVQEILKTDLFFSPFSIPRTAGRSQIYPYNLDPFCSFWTTPWQFQPSGRWQRAQWHVVCWYQYQ